MVCEVKFSDLCKELKERGFISKKAKWQNLTETKIKQALLARAKSAEADQRPVDGVDASLEDFSVCVKEGKPQAFLTN